jgi:preprotein translocase subunit SecG
MRRSRRGGSAGLEFGSSGEDSFVAVVVTKLTGALLFILLLTMVIMALLPKAVDIDQAQHAHSERTEAGGEPLRIVTPGRLPEAITGHPYLVALAAVGGHGPLHWSSAQAMPDWLALDEESGQLSGTPPHQLDEPLALEFQVSDGSARAAQKTLLAVLPPQLTSLSGTWWKPRWQRVQLSTWLEEGIGFLVLWLVHLLGMNLISNFERNSLDANGLDVVPEADMQSARKRFRTYRLVVRLATVAAMACLALWMMLAPVVRA